MLAAIPHSQRTHRHLNPAINVRVYFPPQLRPKGWSVAAIRAARFSRARLMAATTAASPDPFTASVSDVRSPTKATPGFGPSARHSATSRTG